LRKIQIQDAFSITDEHLGALAMNCPQLERVGLSRCNVVTDAGLTLLVNSCTRLQSVWLCFSLVTTKKTIKALQLSHPHIKHFGVCRRYH
jgi:hypothetical protein